MLARTESIPLQMITVNPQVTFWYFCTLTVKPNSETFAMRRIPDVSVCSEVLSATWHVERGRAEMIRFCHTVVTQPWLSTDCTTWAAAILISGTTGSCQVHVGLWCGGVLSQSCLHNLVEVKISRMNISSWNDEQSEVYFIMQIKSVFGCLCGCVLLTGSLEVDASHLHRVRWVMGHHLCVAQKALGAGLRVLALAAQTPVSQKSN